MFASRVFRVRLSVLRPDVLNPAVLRPAVVHPAARRLISTGTVNPAVLRPATQRVFATGRRLATGAGDYYSVLGLSRRPPPTAKQIKQAYFVAAKASHPDLHPGSEEQFKRVAEAYDVLRDPAARATYDAGNHYTGGAQQQHQQRSQQPRGSPRRAGATPKETFQRVWADLGMGDIDDYIKQIQLEMGQAVGSATKHGDFGPAWSFAAKHRGLIIGTLLPVTLLVRSPALTSASLRLIGPIFFVARAVLPVHIQWYLFSRLWVAACKYVVEPFIDGVADPNYLRDKEEKKKRNPHGYKR